MTKPIQLCRLIKNRRAVIVKMEPSPLQERLRGLGLNEGTTVTALFRSPFGDPTAYLVTESVIALRRSDCTGIWVEDIGDGDA